MRLKDVKLGTKVVVGFVVMAIITAILGASSWIGIRKMRTYLAQHAYWGSVDMGMNEGIIEPALALIGAMERYRFQPTPANFENLQKKVTKAADGIGHWNDLVKGHPRLVQVAQEAHNRISGIQEAMKEMAKHQTNMRELRNRGDQLLQTLVAFIEKTVEERVSPAMEAALKGENAEAMLRWFRIDTNMKELVVIRTLKMQTAAHDYEHTGSEKVWNLFAKRFRDAMGGIKAWRELVADQPQLAKAGAQIETYLRSYAGVCTDYHDEMADVYRLANKIQKDVQALLVTSEKAMDQVIDPAKDAQVKATESAQRSIQKMTSILFAAAVLIALLLSILLTRNITRSTRKVIDGLNEGAEQVASAAEQVAAASQSLAEGASEQASGIEETSSSLEEMESMTRQNAENAGMANSLMNEVKDVIAQASKAMGHLTTSMKEITSASEETQKIVKTIDEIAFQTNLLALNAAVEAARAGEAGAGFAVVADEVRSLAIRAAEAAGNTAELIEDTITKVKGGEGLTSTTSEAFSKVADKASKVAELIDEIAEASKEQSLGIEQITKAVAEMNKVVQNNAATAEESASASEQLSAQAEQMKSMVGELVKLIEGKSFAAEVHGRGALLESQNGFQDSPWDPSESTPSFDRPAIPSPEGRDHGSSLGANERDDFF